MLSRLGLAGALALLAGVSFTGRAADVADDIVQLSEDTYVIRRDERPIYKAGSVSKQKKQIVEDAREFAESRGKRAEEIAFGEEEHLLNEYYGTHSWEYRFRLVDRPGGAAAATTSAVPGQASQPAQAADGAVAREAAPATAAPASGAAVAAAATTGAAGPADPGGAVAPAADAAPEVDEIYDQLMKLDELRRKGILTDAEFETLKQRVLSAD